MAGFQTLLARSTFIGTILAACAAEACQQPQPMSLEENLHHSLAAVQAKVVATEVRDLNQLGEVCESGSCEILEVRLEIFESFKGDPDDYLVIFAPIPFWCVFPPMIPGWEYVLFLEDHDGLIMPTGQSFRLDIDENGFSRNAPEIQDLRILGRRYD